MEKIESPSLPGFYDGEVYTSIMDFWHTEIDEYNSQDLNKDHIEWLKNNGFARVNENDNFQLYFTAGTQFTKLTTGVLDFGDCWQRFALTANPEIKFLLSDGLLADLYQIFGIEEPDEDEEERWGYEYAPSDTEGWFA